MLPDGSLNAFPVPRPLSKEEIQSIVQDYATAAHNAIEIAGVIPPQLLFQTPQGGAMTLFMWQGDIMGIANIIDACLERAYTSAGPPMGERASDQP
jgi:hypothetical protein